MKPLDPDSTRFIQDLIDECHDLTLATVRPDGYPQATTVSYANDGMAIYVGVGLDSQKAHNIQEDGRVSLTINRPYSDWNQIQGLSMAATASIVRGAEETAHARECMQRKFPNMAADMAGLDAPWGSVIFLHIAPTLISVLDYTKGFGHTELFATGAGA